MCSRWVIHPSTQVTLKYLNSLQHPHMFRTSPSSIDASNPWTSKQSSTFVCVRGEFFVRKLKWPPNISTIFNICMCLGRVLCLLMQLTLNISTIFNICMYFGWVLCLSMQVTPKDLNGLQHSHVFKVSTMSVNASDPQTLGCFVFFRDEISYGWLFILIFWNHFRIIIVYR